MGIAIGITVGGGLGLVAGMTLAEIVRRGSVRAAATGATLSSLASLLVVMVLLFDSDEVNLAVVSWAVCSAIAVVPVHRAARRVAANA
ncbi:hypothetical protein [Aeromicrobium sp. CTD01-1L150]|uniref:hypothetical protein n=1 Tax=Aeromicrobium sp. CTD01-1L150 TaxID=3341830 RepID=UPI0035C0A1E9